MPKELTITLVGRGTDERLSAQSLAEALEQAIAVLKGIDAHAAGASRESPIWEIARVSMNSPLEITIAQQAVLTEDRSSQTIRTFMRGMRLIEVDPSPPIGFDDSALEATQRLLRLLANGVAKMRFSAPGESAVSPSLHAAANLESISSPQIGTRYEIGTIEGTLEVISKRHDQQVIYIWDVRTGARVECTVSDQDFDKAKAAMVPNAPPKRVAVGGRIKTRGGRPVSVEVSTIRILRDAKELPQPVDIGRVNITGGVDPVEFIRKIRNAR